MQNRIPQLLNLRWSMISVAVIGGAAIFMICVPDTSCGGTADSDSPRRERRRYALLIGCTDYQNPNINSLVGPANDVAQYDKLLSDPQNGFGFSKADVTPLVGWPDNPQLRPSYKNIVAAFEQLVAKAGPNTQIFILMAGHGVQVPVPEDCDPFDPDNPEPDGMDEVFLPADVQSWKKPEGLEHAIRDNQIGQWLQQMRAKGADVWIVFDCCHSGSMSRSAEDLERPRSVYPRDLQIPDSAIEAASRRVKAAKSKQPQGISRFENGTLHLPESPGSRKQDGGSIVAFYAAQAWETAPELPRPKDAPATDDHYHGLMSYTLAECLHQRQNPMSYRELSQLLVSRYRSDRRSRSPTPVFEGDLDREVLGVNEWPQRHIFLQRHQGQLCLNAGELEGLTIGSILAVYPPASDRKDPKTLLGFVKVVRLTPITAEIEPCPFEGHVPRSPDDLPELAPCKVVSRQFGDMRVKLAVRPPANPNDPDLVEKTGHLSAALKQRLSEKVMSLVNLVSDETKAEWILQVVTPEQAMQKYGHQIPMPTVMLLQGDGRKAGPITKLTAGKSSSMSEIHSRKIYGLYPADDTEKIAACLNRDLPKIFKWQNVWRIAGAMDATGSSKEEHGLIFEVAKLKDAEDQSGGTLLSDSFVEPGQILEYRFENDSDEDLWVTAMFLDANLGITHYFSHSLRAGRERTPIRVQITDDSTGMEGMVVFAVPTSLCAEPNYRFLEQEPLGVVDPSSRSATMRTNEKTTPLEQLMYAVTVEENTRGGRLIQTKVNPKVLSRSWVTMPRTD